MARPERNNVDYFPFLCKEGKAMFYIEKTYGNDGYAAWVRILRQLAVTNFHYINLSDKVELMYLSSRCNISSETLIKIINDLCDLDEFDKDLWVQNSIIYSHKFIKNIQDAYKKRNNKCLSYDGLLLLLSGLGIRKPSKSITKAPVNPHTIVEYSIVEYSKEDILLEKETKEIFSFRNELLNKGGSEKLVDDWLKVRKTKKATNSETALIGFINQVNISKKGINEILEICISKDWKGFEAKWLDNLQNKNLQNGTRQQPLLGRQSADTVRSNASGWDDIE
jgi:hypothetical protein